MTTLVALWQLSLALCAIALVALLALLLARAVAGSHETRRVRERQRLTPLLLSGATGEVALPRRRLEQVEAMRLTVELAEMVRGPDRVALLDNAAALGVRETLRRRSRSRVPQERLLAAEALAMFPDETDRVTALLADRNPDVRLGAALALAQNHAAPGPAKLVHRLGLGTSERSLLVVSLMRDLVEADPQGVEDMLYDPALPDAPKLAATDALAESGRVEHAPLVAWMAEAAEEDSALLPRIYRALGRIGHPGGHRAIRRGLDHPSWAVRTAAAQAAGASAFAGATGRLCELLGDAEWWVRFRAGEALFLLGPAGRERLEHIAASGPTAVAREAARATLAERTPA